MSRSLSLRYIFHACLLIGILVACIPVSYPNQSTPARLDPTFTEVPESTLAPSNSPEPTATTTFTPTLTPLPSDTAVPTPTATFTDTPTITPTSAPVVLRGKVLEHSNCRYGPGAVFLYKYGILPTTNMEIIGRDQAGTWLLVRAIGGDNPCWLKATLMDVRGDVLSIPEVDPDIIQAWSPYYGPLTGVSATRNGSEVTVFWDPLILKAGDDSLQTPYVIEAWVCTGGKITFTVAGSYTTAARITDEPGCSALSHGRVYGAEKHGYTRWVEIPWPP
jgi:hypothetical protein